ncbi:MAG: NAD(P)H-dependent oxidoreductase subunit E [Nitrospirae bacterium]|nr:NAD(P)H-dependent oxidoreductase subunit E [Nitrospirota bacterium]
MEIKVNEVIGYTGEVLTERQKKTGILIHALQKIQEEYNYLPEDVLKKLSEKLAVPLSDIYSTASFYKQFYFTPRGKNIIKVCMGTACHVRGSAKVLRSLEEEFDMKEGETTPDLSMTLETVGCIGCCGLAPVATINENIVGEMDENKVNDIIEIIKTGKDSE